VVRVRKLKGWVCLCTFLAAGLALADGNSSAALSPKDFKKAVIQDLSGKFPLARIEIPGDPIWFHGVPDSISSLISVVDTQRGEVIVKAQGGSRNAEAGMEEFEGKITFSALVPAWIAKRRIQPGERLKSEDFSVQDVNVAYGMNREFRGVILPASANLNVLESKQTILEGQFALSSGVKRVPDVRRGDVVRLSVMSGEVSLSLQGTAEEPAYINDSVRVMTLKTKKQMIGKLGPNGSVEVRL
jgi:flagella basal body P-ring formation protein FlgA